MVDFATEEVKVSNFAGTVKVAARVEALPGDYGAGISFPNVEYSYDKAEAIFTAAELESAEAMLFTFTMQPDGSLFCTCRDKTKTALLGSAVC